jgi:hypothetical protein
MRFRFVWLLAVLLLMAGSAKADTFTFEFVLPDWSINPDPSVFGTNAVLDITVSNPSITSPDSATFVLRGSPCEIPDGTFFKCPTDVTQLTVSTIQGGGTFTDTFVLEDAHGAYGTQSFTTDASGVPTLDANDFDGDTVPCWVAADGSRFCIGPVLNGLTDSSSGSSADAYRLSPLQGTLPEPSSLSLTGLGIVALCLFRRRRFA